MKFQNAQEPDESDIASGSLSWFKGKTADQSSASDMAIFSGVMGSSGCQTPVAR